MDSVRQLSRPSHDIDVSRVRPCRRTPGVRPRSQRATSARGHLRRQDPKGAGPGRAPDRSPEHLQADGQYYDSSRAQYHCPRPSTANRRRGDRMRRRELIAGLGATVWPLHAQAQQADRIRHIGVLMTLAAGDQQSQRRITAFVQGLETLGWTEGRNVRIDYRWSAANAEDIRKYAAELV